MERQYPSNLRWRRAVSFVRRPLAVPTHCGISLQRCVMVFVMSVYKVRVADAPVFCSAFDRAGIWPRIANTLPGYVHADLMVRSGSQRVFFLHQFWETAEHFQMAQRSDAYQSLTGFLATFATGYMDLGVFGFRPEITRTRMAAQANSARW